MQKYLAPKNVKFTVSGIQSEITSHAKEQENMTHNEKEKNWNRSDMGDRISGKGGKTVFYNCIPYA